MECFIDALHRRELSVTSSAVCGWRTWPGVERYTSRKSTLCTVFKYVGLDKQ